MKTLNINKLLSVAKLVNMDQASQGFEFYQKENELWVAVQTDREVTAEVLVAKNNLPAQEGVVTLYTKQVRKLFKGIKAYNNISIDTEKAIITVNHKSMAGDPYKSYKTVRSARHDGQWTSVDADWLVREGTSTLLPKVMNSDRYGMIRQMTNAVMFYNENMYVSNGHIMYRNKIKRDHGLNGDFQQAFNNDMIAFDRGILEIAHALVKTSEFKKFGGELKTYYKKGDCLEIYSEGYFSIRAYEYELNCKKLIDELFKAPEAQDDYIEMDANRLVFDTLLFQIERREEIAGKCKIGGQIVWDLYPEDSGEDSKAYIRTNAEDSDIFGRDPEENLSYCYTLMNNAGRHKVGLNPQYLKETLEQIKASNCEEVRVQIKTNLEPVIFHFGDSAHIIMPIRLT